MKATSSHLAVALLALTTSTTNAQLILGSAASFGAIAGSAINNVGTTWVGGNVGTYPGLSIVGFPSPGTATGSINPGTALAANAEKYCLTAFRKGQSLPPTAGLPGPNIGGYTLPPNVYVFSVADILLTGVLTLDGASNPNGQFVFIIKASFTTSVSAVVKLINGAQACNVYFIVGSVAGLQDATQFQGNILAYETIKVGKQVSNYGTLCTVKGPISLLYDKLQAYTSTCYY